MQVPQELSSLTTLTKLSLHENYAPVEQAPDSEEDEHGRRKLPKMRLTEESLRFLLHFPHLKIVYLSATREEREALAGFRADMRRVRKGRNVLHFKLSQHWGWITCM